MLRDISDRIDPRHIRRLIGVDLDVAVGVERNADTIESHPGGRWHAGR